MSFGEEGSDHVTGLQLLLFKEQTGGMCLASPQIGVKKGRKTESCEFTKQNKMRAACKQSMSDKEEEEEFMDAKSFDPSPQLKQSNPDNDLSFQPSLDHVS